MLRARIYYKIVVFYIHDLHLAMKPFCINHLGVKVYIHLIKKKLHLQSASPKYVRFTDGTGEGLYFKR